MLNMPVLETPRLYLRPFQPESWKLLPGFYDTTSQPESCCNTTEMGLYYEFARRTGGKATPPKPPVG